MAKEKENIQENDCARKFTSFLIAECEFLIGFLGETGMQLNLKKRFRIVEK